MKNILFAIKQFDKAFLAMFILKQLSFLLEKKFCDSVRGTAGGWWQKLFCKIKVDETGSFFLLLYYFIGCDLFICMCLFSSSSAQNTSDFTTKPCLTYKCKYYRFALPELQEHSWKMSKNGSNSQTIEARPNNSIQQPNKLAQTEQQQNKGKLSLLDPGSFSSSWCQ